MVHGALWKTKQLRQSTNTSQPSKSFFSVEQNTVLLRHAKAAKASPQNARSVQLGFGHATSHVSFMINGHMDPFWKHGAQRLADARISFRGDQGEKQGARGH
jgi:hypothetical protein